MFETGTSGVELVRVLAEAARMAPVDEPAKQFANQAGVSGISTLFNLIEFVIYLFIGFVVLAAVFFFTKGALMMMQAAGNDQLLSRARWQLVLSIAGGGLAASAFFGIGTFIDILYEASGGAIVDVGNISQAQPSGRQVPPGSFLGIYGGEVILCPAVGSSGPILQTSDDGTAATATWSFTAASGTDVATCTRN